MYAAKHFLTTPLSKLSTVVLVDRNHNLYPIKSDYVGLSLATTLKEYINVKFKWFRARSVSLLKFLH